ncbi:MAG: hypothetical protein LBD23_14465 [Oscillospiraceae bacterium]|jgi:hypothetical protein|nr:hypothetical protein [Oscillospiraceae bacterium]
MAITIRQFEMAVRATIEKKLQRSIKVLGPTGIGKSEVINKIAESYKFGVVDIRLLLWSLTDLKGIPYPDDTHTYTKWLINDVLPRPDRDGVEGVLLLEELDDAPKTVRAAAYQLTLDRKLGNYVLGDGWYVIATSNRAQDGGAYTAPLAPLNDRFEIHEVEPDFITWRDYAIKTGCNPLVVAYLSANQTALYTYKSEESIDLVFATPRSWVAVSDLLDSGLEGEVLRIKTEANIGAVESSGFFKYLKNTKLLPDIEALLNGLYYKKNEKIPYTATLDAYWLLIQNIIHMIGTEFKKKGSKWRFYSNNSIVFICNINNFPLELKKSYIDQLCEIDIKIREFIYNNSRNRELSKLLQELEYVSK